MSAAGPPPPPGGEDDPFSSFSNRSRRHYRSTRSSSVHTDDEGEIVEGPVASTSAKRPMTLRRSKTISGDEATGWRSAARSSSARRDCRGSRREPLEDVTNMVLGAVRTFRDETGRLQRVHQDQRALSMGDGADRTHRRSLSPSTIGAPVIMFNLAAARRQSSQHRSASASASSSSSAGSDRYYRHLSPTAGHSPEPVLDDAALSPTAAFDGIRGERGASASMTMRRVRSAAAALPSDGPDGDAVFANEARRRHSDGRSSSSSSRGLSRRASGIR